MYRRKFLHIKRNVFPCKMNLSQLPTSSTAPFNQQDINLVNHIFGPADSTVDRKALSSSLKMPLIVALIVGIMLNPMSDELICKFYARASENKYSMIVIKMVLAAIIFFIINHWSLSRA